MPAIKKAAVIGGGVIGAGWAARFLANGVAVSIYDPAPESPRKVAEVIKNAGAAYGKLFSDFSPPPPPEFAESAAAAVRGAELIVEAAPEQIEIKQNIYAEIEKVSESAIIASSTSGIRPSALQEKMKHPARFLVAHPFNPVYLLPLVELVGGQKTAPETIARAAEIYAGLGMHPLRVQKEIDGHVADRILEAAWREALWLVKDGIADTKDIDGAVCLGFGLRWAQMGIFDTYRIAGGEGGIKHFLLQFGPCLKWPWTKLTDVPELTEEFAEKIAAQSDAQSGKYSVREMERIRDDNLTAFLNALKANKWGAGVSLARWESELRAKNPPPEISADAPLQTLRRRVPQYWTDYNGHMNESRYLECFSEATDAVMRQIGADENYIAAGNSYFTVETQIKHIKEISAEETLHVESRVLFAEGKKLRLFHEMKNENGEPAATGEHLLIHVNLQTRRSSEPSEAVSRAAQKAAAARSKPPPAGN